MLWLCILRVLHGLGAALFIPLALAIVTDLSRQGEHGRAMGWYTFSSQLGMMAGPIAGGYVVQHFGFQAAFYGCAILPLLALALVLTRIRAIPQKPAPVEGHSTHPWRWLAHPGAIMSLLALVATAVASAGVSTFIPLYVLDFGIAESGAGIIITACYASSAALRIPSGGMADRFGNTPMVLAGTFVSAIAIALIPAFHSLWPLAAVGLLYGVGMGISMPASLSWLAHLSPPDKRGFCMGLGSAAFQVGLALGSTTLGVLVQHAGFSFMYLATAIFMGLGVAVMAALSQAVKRSGHA
jgi:MFS family permease